MDNADRKLLQDLLKRRAVEHTETAEAAREWLIREGIYDDEGNLLPQFGGERPADERD